MTSLQGSLVKFLLKKSNVWNKPVNEVREAMAKIKANGFPKEIDCSQEVYGGVSCEIFENKHTKATKHIVYFHGGGFCLGIYAANKEFVAQIALETGMNVIMPDYRLAPENPYPAALEDAKVVITSLYQHGFAAKDLFIIGDSSGCALVVSALLELKSEGLPMPAAMAFITPLFDLTGNGESFASRSLADPFKLDDPLCIARNYFGQFDTKNPRLSPLFGDLAGLPPMLLHGAEDDVFLSDAQNMKAKSEKAGVSVELKVWKKMWHIFHMQYSFVPEAKRALVELCQFIKNF